MNDEQHELITYPARRLPPLFTVHMSFQFNHDIRVKENLRGELKGYVVLRNICLGFDSVPRELDCHLLLQICKYVKFL